MKATSGAPGISSHRPPPCPWHGCGRTSGQLFAPSSSGKTGSMADLMRHVARSARGSGERAQVPPFRSSCGGERDSGKRNRLSGDRSFAPSGRWAGSCASASSLVSRSTGGISDSTTNDSDGPDASKVDRFATELPPHRVGVKVMPGFAGIEVEDEPSDALTTAPDDGGCVPHEPAAIDAVRRHGGAVFRRGRVMEVAVVNPPHDAADPNGDLARAERHGWPANNRDGHRVRTARNDMHDPGHLRVMAAEDSKVSRGVEGELRLTPKLLDVIGIKGRLRIQI